VFARDDNIGIDGRAHTELAAAHGPGLRKHSCACGFQADDMPDFDDHLLIVFIPEDNTGNDGERHVPVNTSTPIRWHVRRAIDD
jgi:hypothetical protein